MNNCSLVPNKLKPYLGIGVCLIAGFLSNAASALEFTPRIVGGDIVPDNRYPFMAAISRDIDKDGSFYFTCGGSLVGTHWVLTAAHCVVDSEDGVVYSNTEMAVTLGQRDLTSSSLTLMDVRQIIVHPAYTPGIFNNDIALIELIDAASNTTVTLPMSTDDTKSLTGKPTFAAGWGLTSEDGEMSTLLRDVVLPIVSYDRCLETYPDIIDQLHLCAGGTPYHRGDTCQGDSGGPLMIARGSTIVQVGIVSFGDGCGRPGVPGVYTNLTNYTDWVASFVGDLTTVEDPAEPNVIQLFSDSPYAGIVKEGEYVVFDVTGGQQVNLFKLDGDVELTITTDPTFNSNSIICLSTTSCVLSDDTPLYAKVYGYVSSSYIIDVIDRYEAPLTPVTSPPKSKKVGIGSIGLDVLIMLMLATSLCAFTGRGQKRASLSK